jgi:beta-glucosidase-like glycosyl hydrolase
MKTFASVGMALLGMTVMAAADPQTTQPKPPATLQLNTEFLNDLMRSAMMFNGMVQNLNLNKTLHDSGVASNGTKRTAAVLGAGAGVGLAVGGMTGSQKGAMIGAVAGGAGAYVIDQIVQHQQAAKARLANQDSSQYNPQYQYNDRAPQQLKERPAQQQ